MKQFIENIKKLKDKLVIKLNPNIITSVLNNEDVLFHFPDIKQNKKKLIANYEGSYEIALASLIQYEKNPTYKNWQNLTLSCFSPNELNCSHVTDFYENSHLNPIFYYALKFNILDCSYSEISQLDNYSWKKQSHHFSLDNLSLSDETLLSIVAHYHLDSLPYLIEHNKINLKTCNSYAILTRIMLKILEKSPEEQEKYFEKIIVPLEKRGVEFASLLESNTYKDVKNLYKQYQNYVIKKESEHLNNIVNESFDVKINLEPNKKRKNKI